MMLLRLLPLLAAGISCLCLPAQQTITTASLEGRVTDTTGALVVGASIVVRRDATKIDTRATTGSDGAFRISYLAIGDYDLAIGAPSFQTETRRLTLIPGANLRLAVSLHPTSGTTTMTLDEGGLEPVTDSRSQLSSDISPLELAQLPFLSRNFLDLALLAPGVSQTNTASTQLFAETSAVPGQGLSINSQRNFSNSFLVDGLSANDDAAGLVQASFPLDSLAELQVVTSGGQAEFGRALGGYLNFVTRGGTSAFHGSGYGYLRNQRLNAANALSQTTLPMTQAQFGGSLGGPIVRGRTFFFANGEQRNLNQNGIFTITPANAAAIDARLVAVSYPGQLLAIATPATLYPNPSHATNVFAKLDHRFSDRDTLSARYSLYKVASRNSRGAGSLSYTSAAAALYDFDQTVALSNVFVLTPQTVNETRAQCTHSLLDAPANDPTGPAVSVSGIATFGTLSSSPTARYDSLLEFVDNLSHTRRAHTFRIGADVLYNDLVIRFPQSIRGSYAFASLANFQSGRYTTFTQSFGNAVVPQTNPNLGLYAQDEWRATPSLTFNAGIRYDLQFLQAVSTDADNLSPRLGLAWTPFPNRRTVVRASYGLFYDRLPLRALSNALESNGNSTVLTNDTFVTLALSLGQAGAPVFPAVNIGFNATNLPANVRLSLTTMDPHIQNAYAQQGALEVEQQITPHTTLSLNFQHVRGEHLLLSVNLNSPSCLAAVDPINLCRPNSDYANNKQYKSSADSIYDGLGLSLVQRPVRFGSLRVSYTWSHAFDDLGEFFFSSPINNFNISQDWSRSDDDQRHRLTFDGILHTSPLPAHSRLEHLTHGFQLGGILQYTSAPPFNIVTGGNTVQTTTQRPCAPGYTLSANAGVNPCTLGLPGAVIGRNAGVGFDSVNLNTRLSRTIHLTDRVELDAIAEAFNTLNHRNNLIPLATFGTAPYPGTAPATFNTPTAVADPRSLELALRMTF